MSDPIRICLLVEETVTQWQLRAIRRTLSERNAEISLLVVNQRPARSRAEKLSRALELREWIGVALLLSLEDRLKTTAGLDQSVPIDDVPEFDGVDRVSCVPEEVDGWKYRIPENVVERAEREADVAALFGFGFIVGPILSAFEHGVLSFHHGDLREYRGQPMGFWEYLYGEDEAGVTLQRINDTLDGGEIIYLKRVDISDAGRWRGVKQDLLAASTDMLSEGIRRVQDDSFTPDRPTDLGDLYTIPKGRPVGKFVAKTLANTVVSR